MSDTGTPLALEDALPALLIRFGAQPGVELQLATQRAVAASIEALQASADEAEGEGLTQLEVVRIRLNKFAATRLPARLFRDPRTLACLRAELRTLALAFVADERALAASRARSRP